MRLLKLFSKASYNADLSEKWKKAAEKCLNFNLRVLEVSLNKRVFSCMQATLMFALSVGRCMGWSVCCLLSIRRAQCIAISLAPLNA